MKKIIATIAASFLAFTIVNAQYTETELIRSAFKLEKKAEVALFMGLSDAEAKNFWSIYDEYESKRSVIGDRRIKLLQQYADAYKKQDGTNIEKLWKESANIQKDEITLREKYTNKIKKSVSPEVALNFYIVEDYISTAVKNEVYNSLSAPATETRSN